VVATIANAFTVPEIRRKIAFTGAMLALYRLGGMAILAAIRRMSYRTDQARPHVSLTAKAGLVPLAFVQSRRRRGYVRTQRAV